MNDSYLIDFVATCLDAPVDPGQWNKSLDLMVDRYGGVSAGLIITDIEHSGRLPIAASELIRGRGRAIYNKYMAKEDADDAEVIARVQRSPINRLRSEHEVFGLRDDEPLPYSAYRDFQHREFGIGERYAAPLNKMGELADLFAFHHSAAGPGLSRFERAEIEGLIPLLARSIRLFRMFEVMRKRHNAMLSALDRLGIGVWLCTDDGQVIHQNVRADEIAELRDGIMLDSTCRLRFSGGGADERFRQLCSTSMLTAQLEGTNAGGVIVVERPSGAPSYVVSIGPVRDKAGEIEEGLGCVLVFVIDPGDTSRLSSEGLVELGKLSKAEAAICKAMVRGSTLAQIAERRGVSLQTVRTQSKSILGKLNCQNRTDLIKLAVTTRLPAF